MLTKRKDHDNHSEITIWNEGDTQGYRITCPNIPTVPGQPPTAGISLLNPARATVEETRRLAAEYTYVADIADALQAEKRAKFEKGK